MNQFSIMETYEDSADFKNNLTFNKEPENKNVIYPEKCFESKNSSNVNNSTVGTETDNKIIDSNSIFLSNDYVKKENLDSPKIVEKEELVLKSKWIVSGDYIVQETYPRPAKLFIMDGLMMRDQMINEVINENTFLSNGNVKMEPLDNSGIGMKKELKLDRELIIKKDHFAEVSSQPEKKELELGKQLIIKKDHSAEKIASHSEKNELELDQSAEKISPQPEKPFSVNSSSIGTQTDNEIIDNTLVSNACVKMEVENNFKTDFKKEVELNTELIIKDNLAEKETGNDGMDRGLVMDKTELNHKVAESPASNLVHKKAYQCPICRFGTNFLGRLASHIESSHRSISDAFRCGQCGFKAFAKIQLQKHHCSGTILFACIICEFTGENKDELSQHIKSVHHMICCPHCLYYSWSEIDLSMHLKVYHPPRTEDSSEAPEKTAYLYECKQCHLKTDNKRYFQLHVSMKHVESEKKQLKWFKCPHCDDYEVVNEDALDNHILRKHTSDAKLHTCVHCKFDTRGGNLFHNHMESILRPKYAVVFYFLCRNEEEQSGRIKTDQIQLRCPGCLFETGNEDILAYHISFNHRGYFNIEFKCYHCNFKSNHKFALYQHKCRETMNNYSFAYFTTNLRYKHPGPFTTFC